MLDIQYSTVSNTKQIGSKLMNLIDIKSPADLKGLSLAELTDLTAQARQALMTKVSEHGGHYQSYGICIWYERCNSFRVLRYSYAYKHP